MDEGSAGGQANQGGRGTAGRLRAGLARFRPAGGRAHLLLLGTLAGAAPLTAQDRIETLAVQCGGADPALVEQCREGVLALQAAQSGIGLLAAGGAQIPGASSTVGRRFGGTPRFSGSLRGGLVRAPLPDVRGGPPPLANRTFLGWGGQGSLALGLFDGFSLIPTIGGVLSVDAFATAGLLLLPGGNGFGGNPVTWGLGANVGLLRESFTMPGVTLSAAYRAVRPVTLGERAAGDVVEVRLDPAVTSVRGVVGKDLLAFGVLAGMGWDRYRSDGTLAVTGPGAATGQTTFDGFTSDRTLFFGGLSASFLVLQLSAEAGWARGFGQVSGRARTGYDPGSTTFFLSTAGRLTL